MAFALFALSQVCDGVLTYNGIRAFGSAVEAFLEQEGEGGLDRLRAMHRRWPFLQALLLFR